MLGYANMPLGARKLALTMMRLPEHPRDRDKPQYLLRLVTALAATFPDAVLLAVAAEIDDLIEHGLLRQQSRYPALAEMVTAALRMDDEIAALVAASATPPTRR